MSHGGIEVFTNRGDILGEGVIWDGAGLWWVDIKRGIVHRSGGASFEAGEPVGSLSLTDDGRIGVALRSGLGFLDPVTGAIERWILIEADRPKNRLNDGRVDRAGRWWIGSMDDTEKADTGALYRVGDGESIRVFDSLFIPNSLAVSPNNDILYFTQTSDRIIFEFKLRPDGELGSGKRFVEVDAPGFPDGACVDADGCLWSAQWGASRVVRYTPEGVIDRIVELPVSNVTCAALGGTDLKTLFVTTARHRLEEAELAAQPLAGSVFAIGVGVGGLPEPRLSPLRKPIESGSREEQS